MPEQRTVGCRKRSRQPRGWPTRTTSSWTSPRGMTRRWAARSPACPCGCHWPAPDLRLPQSAAPALGGKTAACSAWSLPAPPCSMWTWCGCSAEPSVAAGHRQAAVRRSAAAHSFGPGACARPQGKVPCHTLHPALQADTWSPQVAGRPPCGCSSSAAAQVLVLDEATSALGELMRPGA